MPKVKKEDISITVEKLVPDHVINKPVKKSRLSFLPWILIILVVGAAGVFVYTQNRKAEKLKAEIAKLKENPAQISEAETKALLEKVGQLIELPNEQPTIATVTDPNLLKDQAFFANSQTDDRVLIYSAAKKAYLYRPSTNKIIEVAPINLGDNSKTNSNKNGNKNTNSDDNNNANSNSTGNSNKNSTKNSNSNSSN